MPTLTERIRFSVTRSSPVLTGAGIETGLGLFQLTTTQQLSRFGTYASVAALTAAAMPAHVTEWATAVFAQSPRPSRVAIGRRVPGTAQVATVSVTGAAAGTWTYTLNGVAHTYVAGGGDTTQVIATGLRAAIDAGVQPVITSAPIAGVFTVTAEFAGISFTHSITPAGAGTATSTTTTANVAAEDVSDALDAVEAVNAQDWYYYNIDSRDEAEILDAAAWGSARTASDGAAKYFIAQTSDTAARDGTAGNVLLDLQSFEYVNVASVWAEDATTYADGALLGVMSGYDLDAQTVTMGNRTMVGVSATNLTQTQIDNITDADGNVYVSRDGASYLIDGRTAAGEFGEIEIALAWFVARLRAALKSVVLSAPKVVYDDTGIAKLRAQAEKICQQGIRTQAFSSYSIVALSRAEVPDADVQSGNYAGLSITLQPAAPIHTVDPVSILVTI